MSSEKITALILAAGQSVRFGKEDKLLYPWPHKKPEHSQENAQANAEANTEAKPLIQYILDVLLSAEFRKDLQVIVACDAANKPLQNYLSEQPVDMLLVNNAAKGMGHSLKSAIEKTSQNINDTAFAGWLICPADMPNISKNTIANFINQIQQKNSEYNQSNNKIIACQNSVNNFPPVFFHRDLQSELLQIENQSGGKSVINNNLENCIFVNVSEEEVKDIDFKT